MRFAVAPSGFKESLDAPAVAAAIAAGIRRVELDAVIDEIPLVDGEKARQRRSRSPAAAGSSRSR